MHVRVCVCVCVCVCVVCACMCVCLDKKSGDFNCEGRLPGKTKTLTASQHRCSGIIHFNSSQASEDTENVLPAKA